MGGRNVYVKGIGAVSAAGLNVSGHLETLKSGRSPLARTRRFHTAVNAPAGEVSLTDDELKAAAGIPAEEIVSRTVLLGMAAVGEALDDFRARTGRIDPGRSPSFPAHPSGEWTSAKCSGAAIGTIWTAVM